ncbi:MAG: IS110 family transposase, partial [Chloroflexi bacterium]|nr:IS110 family transposase [Chloroflexota bacterium]
RKLRELTRFRTTLVRERAREVNRIQKTLEGANVKLGDVASDVLGTSGRAILDAMVDGTTDTASLADLAQGRLRDKRASLQRAVDSRMGEHQRFLLAEQLTHYDALNQSIDRVSAEIAKWVRSSEAIIERRDAIPGIGRRVAEVLVAEIGTDMSRFPTAAHLASWAGVCPGNNESAGKRKSGRIRRGSPWLRTTLVVAAHAAVRANDTYLSAQLRRLAARRGAKKASVAVAHSILAIVWHLLQHDCQYVDLGTNYFDEHDRQEVARGLIKRLEGLGYRVALGTPHQPSPPSHISPHLQQRRRFHSTGPIRSVQRIGELWQFARRSVSMAGWRLLI